MLQGVNRQRLQAAHRQGHRLVSARKDGDTETEAAGFCLPLSLELTLTPGHYSSRQRNERRGGLGAKTLGITIWIQQHIVLSKQASQASELPE